MAGIVTFDTHAFVKKMIGTGMPEEQAEALAELQAEIVTDRLATKDDLALYHKQTESEFAKVKGEFAKVRGEIKDLGAELRTEMTEQFVTLDKKIETVSSETKLIRSEINLVRSEMQTMGKDITIKLGGTIVVCAGLLFTALRLFPL